jgi:hypothetical protein
MTPLLWLKRVRNEWLSLERYLVQYSTGTLELFTTVDRGTRIVQVGSSWLSACQHIM